MKIFCVTAKSFPYDIKGAFGSLINKLPSIEGRTFFGVSCQTRKGEMIYKAAVLEMFDGETERYDCEPFTIRKGSYISETIKKWRQDETSIGTTFKRLANARRDTTFPCIEWYQGEDVVCMVRIDENTQTIEN